MANSLFKPILELEIESRRRREEQRHRELVLGYTSYPSSPIFPTSFTANTVTQNPTQKLEELKKSVKEIETEPLTGDSRKRVENKILRLLDLGATSQAEILQSELETRDSLMQLKEWDYKLIAKETIESFQKSNAMTYNRDGLKIHIDSLDTYVGNPENGQAKDRIIPDAVLDKLEEAKERELFDEYAVLWVERVKDPLLLGIVHGCEDFFFICEWGDDITFEQITKGTI